MSEQAGTSGKAANRLDWLEKGEALAGGVSNGLAVLSVVSMVGLSLFMVVDVLAAQVFNTGIPGSNELLSLVMVISITACFASGAVRKAHLTIELLHPFVGRQLEAYLRFFAAVLLFGFLTLLAWRFAEHAATLQQRGQTTPVMGMPVAAFFWVATFSILISAVFQLLMVLRALVDLRHSLEGASVGKLFSLVSVAFMATVTVLFVLFQAFGFIDIDGIIPESQISRTLFFVAFLWLLLLLFVPLGVAMGLAGLAGTATVIGAAPTVSIFGTQSADFLTTANVAVLPLFLLMGNLAVAAGLSSDLYRLANVLLGHFKGGLALATLAGSAGFGSVTGSSLATIVTIGKVAIPQMQKKNYAPQLCAGTVAAGGTLGMLIPPSTGLVIYALLAQASVRDLFIAALVPAAISIALYVIVIKVQVWLNPAIAPLAPRPDWSETKQALRHSSTILILILAMIVGLYGGLFTATQAAAVGVSGTFLIAFFRGKLRGEKLWSVMGETVAGTAMIYLLIFGALSFSFFFGIADSLSYVNTALVSIGLSPMLTIFLILCILIALGTIMDPYAIMLITLPITVPLVLDYGFDIVWWGIVMVMVIETGLMSPPVGLNIFVINTISDPKIPMAQIYRGVTPFVLVDLLKISIITLFPAISLWLPAAMNN